jgi:hypothetical protein
MSEWPMVVWPMVVEVGEFYALALDATRGGAIVRVRRFEPLPPQCYRVTRVRPGGRMRGWENAYEATGALARPFWSLPRWEDAHRGE